MNIFTKFLNVFKSAPPLYTVGNSSIDWTPGMVHESAAKYQTASAWRKHELAAKKAAVHFGIYDKVTAHMQVPNHWDAVAIRHDAAQYKTKTDWIDQSSGAVGAAKRLGIYDEVTAHMTIKQ